MPRRQPVEFEDFPEFGLGIIPVIQESDDPPTPEEYAEAARLEAKRRTDTKGGAR